MLITVNGSDPNKQISMGSQLWSSVLPLIVISYMNILDLVFTDVLGTVDSFVREFMGVSDHCILSMKLRVNQVYS